MKTYICFAVCIAMSNLLSAFTISSNGFMKCRDSEAESKADYSTARQMGYSLVNGTWNISNDDEMEGIYLFAEEGLLETLFKDTAGNISYQSNFLKIAELYSTAIGFVQIQFKVEKVENSTISTS